MPKTSEACSAISGGMCWRSSGPTATIVLRLAQISSPAGSISASVNPAFLVLSSPWSGHRNLTASPHRFANSWPIGTTLVLNHDMSAAASRSNRLAVSSASITSSPMARSGPLKSVLYGSPACSEVNWSSSGGISVELHREQRLALPFVAPLDQRTTH